MSSQIEVTMAYIVRAEHLYQRQNQTLHRAFSLLGMPYQEEKKGWIGVFRKLLGRKNIQGLSDLTLGERRSVIAYLSRQGARIKNPILPGELADWTRGDPERTVAIQRNETRYPGRPANMHDPAKGPMLKKIEALLAEANRPWKYVHGISKRMFDVDRVHWCRPDQLHKIVAALMTDARRHSRYTGS